MGLITVIAIRHDLLHDIRANACNVGVALSEALQVNDPEMRRRILERYGVDEQALVFTPTVHTGDVHLYQCGGNTLHLLPNTPKTLITATVTRVGDNQHKWVRVPNDWAIGEDVEISIQRARRLG